MVNKRKFIPRVQLSPFVDLIERSFVFNLYHSRAEIVVVKVFDANTKILISSTKLGQFDESTSTFFNPIIKYPLLA